MKTFVAYLIVSCLGMAAAFPVLPIRAAAPSTNTVLQMGLFDNMFQNPASKQQQQKNPSPSAAASATTKSKKKSSNSNKWIEQFFSSAFHGHGSGEDKLDELYEAQQAVLRERQQLFGGGHQAMRDKYRNPSVDHLRDIKTIDHDPAMLNQKEDEAMYFDDEEGGGFSLPWGNKKLKP